MARNLTVLERQTMQVEILERLTQGEGLCAICDDKGMPSDSTVYGWLANDPHWAEEVSRAREVGYIRLAEQAYRNALTCNDAVKGRLQLDATRWYLGKLSLAFSDNKERSVKLDIQLSPEAEKWLGRG